MSEAIIVVTGAVVARPDTLQALLTASLEHVHRSRLERFCRKDFCKQLSVNDPLATFGGIRAFSS